MPRKLPKRFISVSYDRETCPTCEKVRSLCRDCNNCYEHCTCQVCDLCDLDMMKCRCFNCAECHQKTLEDDLNIDDGTQNSYFDPKKPYREICPKCFKKLFPKLQGPRKINMDI